MADNVALPAASGYAAADEVAYSGQTDAKVQLFRLVEVTGTEGSRVVTSTRAGTATLNNIAGNASSVTLQAANAARLAVVVVNDSTAILYVKYGSTASSTSFSFLLQPGETLREALYTGIVTGVWASATGNARVTELTA
jgi:hypothetical protein